MQMNLLTKRLYSKSQIILFDEQLRRNFIKRLHEKWSLKHPRYRIKSIKNHERNSATLIALIDVDHCPCVLFTHRSLNLRDHRGQVSFPGGRIEDGETSEQAALRECNEEIGLDPSSVDVWGSIRPMYTRNFASIVTPVVGVVKNIKLDSLKALDEVQTVFAAPIEELCKRHGYTSFRAGVGHYRLPVFFTSQFHVIASNVIPRKEYRIWGLTAGMLHMALLLLVPEMYKCDIEIITP